MSIFDFENFRKRPRRKRLLIGITIIATILGLGSTLAVRLTLNTNGQAEFGQGIIHATSCDSNGIKVTPINSFLNQNKSGFFTFNAIQLQHISSQCAGMDFVIRVYGRSGAALPITVQGESEFSEIRVYFQPFSDSIPMSQNDGNLNSVSVEGYWPEQFKLIGDAPIVVGTLDNLYEKSGSNIDTTRPASDFFELNREENAFQISFNPSSEISAGFANTKDVYRISIESLPHQN